MSRYGLLQDTEQRFKEKLRNLDLDRPMARPLHYKMACERCVFGSGEHREDCQRFRTTLDGWKQWADETGVRIPVSAIQLLRDGGLDATEAR